MSNVVAMHNEESRRAFGLIEYGAQRSQLLLRASQLCILDRGKMAVRIDWQVQSLRSEFRLQLFGESPVSLELRGREVPGCEIAQKGDPDIARIMPRS